MIILYIPRCILGMLDHFHGQETFCLVRGSLSCSETPYFHKVVNWRFFMEKNFFFGRGINELVRNALFSSRQPWRSGTRCARRRIMGEASTSIGQESGRRRRGGWRRSRRRTRGTRPGLVRCQHHWSLIHRQVPWLGRWRRCAGSLRQRSETPGQARTSQKQRVQERWLFSLQNIRAWEMWKEWLWIQGQVWNMQASREIKSDGETGSNCYIRGGQHQDST